MNSNGICDWHYEDEGSISLQACADKCEATTDCRIFSMSAAHGCRVSKCGADPGPKPCPADKQCPRDVTYDGKMYRLDKKAVCTGPCDSDNQCATGLKCFLRSKSSTPTRVPGCNGPLEATNDDYCYKPTNLEIELSGTNSGSSKNLQACVGECDNDDMCAPGLKCFQRANGESIPGCKGSGSGKGWDYCYKPIVPLSAWATTYKVRSGAYAEECACSVYTCVQARWWHV